MSFRKTYILVACAIACMSMVNASADRNAKALAIGSLLATAAWLKAQHNFSRLAHERYPLMQRKNILYALIAKEKQPEALAALNSELEKVVGQLEQLRNKRADYQVLRTIFGLCGLGAGIGAWHQYYYPATETTAKK
ncbi:MAG: hypothetical protein QG604_150 [Candidatus Dependentiae bacterium]|nr:hypothetical protein [Candidatus Dependentiae bacterium]